MLRFHPERDKVWRLALVGSVCADQEFSNLEEELRRMSNDSRTLIVDITKLSEISNSGKVLLPHLFQMMKNNGFNRANLLARKHQRHESKIFEDILDHEFGPEGTISLE